MTIHVIHDPKRQERLNLLTKEIFIQDLTVKMWPAIFHGKPIDGIRMAHQAIVRYAKANYLPQICIGEDDLKFTSNGAWKYFINNIPKDFDIYLSSIYGGNLQPDNTCTWFAGLGLYIISQRFYDKFLSVPSGKHIDRGLKNLGKFVVCNPFCCIQHETYSENQKKILDNSKYLGKAKLYGND